MSLTKSSIRENIWSYLEDNNIAQFPRPVFNRIPNFKVSEIDT
jgi:5-formyltetrahydrofolate cyclo-ligase